ncbi:DUF433 domain-containing protein [Sphaerothrix gracilis]|uniref:DUF433 domain-containing protein n=1 Tax=Sphaerothrix gracilis TaxID=3151835 RepID=UPI0031FCDF25
MPATATDYKHIWLDDDQVPFIVNTTMKVVELVTAYLVHGWSPEELHFQYPHVSLGKVHSALAYYWDHKAELDADMQRRYEVSEQLRHQQPENRIKTILQARRLTARNSDEETRFDG